MTFTAAEKLQIAMLCDLAKPKDERELDFDFIREAVSSGDLWALHWQYPGLELNIETPENVRQVIDILEMWERIEESFDKLSEQEKERVLLQSYSSARPHFLGFDGNNESDVMHIAYLLIKKLGGWSVFKNRDLNSHFPSIDGYERQRAAWKPIWEAKIKSGKYDLAPDDLVKILREHIHPDYRQYTGGGDWTFDRASLKK
jgi:hypothetical protein